MLFTESHYIENPNDCFESITGPLYALITNNIRIEMANTKHNVSIVGKTKRYFPIKTSIITKDENKEKNIDIEITGGHRTILEK